MATDTTMPKHEVNADATVMRQPSINAEGPEMQLRQYRRDVNQYRLFVEVPALTTNRRLM